MFFPFKTSGREIKLNVSFVTYVVTYVLMILSWLTIRTKHKSKIKSFMVRLMDNGGETDPMKVCHIAHSIKVKVYFFISNHTTTHMFI